jgi:hypothetical protein
MLSYCWQRYQSILFSIIANSNAKNLSEQVAPTDFIIPMATTTIKKRQILS